MRTPLLTATAVALTVVGIGPASAAFLVDFTDAGWADPITTPVDRTYNAPFGDFIVRVGAVGGTIDNSEPGPMSTGCSSTGQLACATDGFGIGDDEVTNPAEALTVDFFETDGTTPLSLTVTGLEFFDTFTHPDPNNSDKESAIVTPVGGPSSEFFAIEPFSDNGGYLNVSAVFSGITGLKIEAGSLNDGQQNPDIALAGVHVVPLPAAAWMMVGGLGLVYGATRRRRARALAT